MDRPNLFATRLIIRMRCRARALSARKRFRLATLLCALGAALGDPATAIGAAFDETRIVREDARLALIEGCSRIVIDNPLGDVHLRAGRAGSIAHHAVIQHIDTNLQPPTVQLRAGADCATISVAIPGQGASQLARWNVRRARVDLAIAVPPTVAITVRAPAGAIDAKKLDNAIEARTRDGDIILSVSGDIDARSERGRIVLTERPAQHPTRWRATSTSGAIAAFVATTTLVRLRARSCAGISTELPAIIVRRWWSRCMTARIDQTGSVMNMNLRSRSGRIELLRMES